jgi:hypothetical protein
VLGGINYVVPAKTAGLSFGLYANWDIAAEVPPVEAAFWQMLRITEEGSRETWAFVAEVIAAQPGSVWIVGNEPDVIWQDNVTPERYAEIYHEAYTFIKERDPLAQLAMAGVAQPTPLGLAYLERVLLAYQEKFGEPMPVDIWTVHAFILREEAGSWGVFQSFMSGCGAAGIMRMRARAAISFRGATGRGRICELAGGKLWTAETGLRFSCIVEWKDASEGSWTIANFTVQPKRRHALSITHRIHDQNVSMRQ